MTAATPVTPNALNVTKEGIEVKAGQIWQDLDKRMKGRQCKVQSVVDGKAYMVGHSRVTNTVSAIKTRLSVSRMHKSSTGWALVG